MRAVRSNAFTARANARTPRSTRATRRHAASASSSAAPSSSCRTRVEFGDDVNVDTASLSSRRRALGAFACASLSVAISLTSTSTEFAARADDEDEELAELEANMKRVMETNSGEQTFVRQIGLRSSDKANVRACAFEVSSLWRVDGARVVDAMTTEWGTIVDPVNGEAVQGARAFATPDFGVKSIDDLGKPENVAVAKVLGLDGEDSYRRADMLGAAKRVDASTGQVYYDWELVASPPAKSCPSAVGCLYPEHIYLISASVLDGVLYVLSLDATPAQWRVTGNSVKRIRNSFTVGVADEAPTSQIVDAATA